MNLDLEEIVVGLQKRRVETDKVLDPIFENKKPKSPEEAFLWSHLYGVYRLLLKDSISLSADGSLSPHESLPSELLPAIKSTKVSSLSVDELEKNWEERRMQVLEITERGIKDLLWFRGLWRRLYEGFEFRWEKILEEPAPVGEYQLLTEENKEVVHLLTTVGIGAGVLAQALFEISGRLFGPSCYILGIGDNGKVYKKALPGIDFKKPETLQRRFDNWREMTANGFYFWTLPPEYLNAIVGEGERWTHLSSSTTNYPTISGGFEVGDQLIRFGLDHKHYFSPHPHEVIIRSGDIDTITVMDLSPLKEGVIYKVKHLDGTITVGDYRKSPESNAYLFYPSDYFASFLMGELRVLATDWQGIASLIGAIARDMFVCEEVHKFYKMKGGKQQREETARERKSTVKWIPRFKVVYDLPLRAITKVGELEEKIFSVAPQPVAGHPYRLPNGKHANSFQLELAKHFGVVIPTGYTFVRPYEKGEYEVQYTLYKSRSALQTLFGAHS